MSLKNIYTSTSDIEDYIQAGKISVQILKEIKKKVNLGITPYEINQLAGELCKKNGVLPAFLGVEGEKQDFPGNICVCVNDETLHAIPFSKRKFQSGDIVKLDFGIVYKEFVTDHCITIGLGKLTEREKLLIKTAELCVQNGIKKAISGNMTGDISQSLHETAKLEKFEYVLNYASHGIGKVKDGGLHMAPSIPSYGKESTGVELQDGLTITVENQLSMGSSNLVMDDDGWTLRTVDGSKTAMFEHTIMINGSKPLILTSF